ncbi:MAG: leucine-rich repeat domain-containing protein, partial [Candidatus Sulfotelmatobacter sp.]
MADDGILQKISQLIGQELPRAKSQDSIEKPRLSPGYYSDENGHVTSLNLSYLDLDAVPEEVGELIQLKSLRLVGNRLTALPDAFFEKLTSLEVLGLNGNRLEDLPESISSLSKLRLLKFNNNRFREIPFGLHGLRSLRALFVGSNPLTEVPEWLDIFAALEELSIAQAPVATLPSSLTRLQKLRYLRLS